MSLKMTENTNAAILEIILPGLPFSLLCRVLTCDEITMAWGLFRANKISGISPSQSNGEVLPLIFRMGCVGWKTIPGARQGEDLTLELVLEKINNVLTYTEKFQLVIDMLDWSLLVLKHKKES